MKHILLIVAFILVSITGVRKLQYELHMLQSNSYRNKRYRNWLRKTFLSQRLGILDILLAILAVIVHFFPTTASLAIIVLMILVFYRFISQKHKKKLVFTKRAKRLFAAMLLLFVLDVVFCALLLKETPAVAVSLIIIMYWFTFLFATIANTLMQPIEQQINNWYVKDATRILQSMPNLIKIGITGSYGKTSVKHFLHHILSEKYNVLMTPGSYNTPMGVVITTRMHLKPIHEIFIAEMGAKQLGDIKEICDIVHPHIGILTAIGPQHLETFLSIENVQTTKYELPNALPKNGKGIAYLNYDFEHVASYPPIAGIKSFTYGLQHPNVNYAAKNLAYTSQGISFTLYEGNELVVDLQTRLLGEHNVSNIVVACAVALNLGVPVSSIKYAVKSLKPVQHRLELKNQGGITILDDAFNSNPKGAAMAVEVLGKIKGNKKIIITPGMIELGEKEYELNKVFGTQMAEHCDYVILVGRKQTAAIQDGLAEVNYPTEKLYVATSLNDANQHLKTLIAPGDVVLYENDLPDMYNE